MPIDYHRTSATEWDRTEGIGAASLAGMGIGILFLVIGSLNRGPWPILIGAVALIGGILGMIQGLFDVVVYLADPETGTLIVRRIVWRKVDEEFTLPLDELESFEVEHRGDARWNCDGDSTRIVARMKSGDRIPLIKEFSSSDLFQKAEMLNRKLRALREKPASSQRLNLR